MAIHRTYLLALFTGYALCCWLFFEPMMRALHGHWIRPNDLDAGYLLLAVTAFVFWQTGQSLAPQTAPKPQREPPARKSPFNAHLLAATAVVVCLSVAGLTAMTANKSVTLALLLMSFVPLAVTLWGTPIFSRVLHGCAILLMATPIWFVLVPALQTLTAVAVNWLLQMGRWPVYVEGNLIAVPYGVLEIAAGCAGLKFVQTALTLTLIEGFLANRSWRAMLVLGACAAALAVLCNWLRVSAITLLALYLDITHPWVADHNWVGWLVFVILLGPFFYALGNIRLFARIDDDAAIESPTKSRGLLLAALCLMLGFGASWGLAQLAEGEASRALGEEQLSTVRRFCETDATRAQSLQPHPASAKFPGAELTLDCALGNGLFLSLRGYVIETQGREVINPANELVPGLPLLDFSVADARNSSLAPGRFTNANLSLAYGFYAAGSWHAAPEAFKLRSLLRPLKPGPVWALVIVGDAKNTELAATYNEVSAGLSSQPATSTKHPQTREV